MDNKKEVKSVAGKTWNNVGVYNSYEEANMSLSHMIASQPTYDFKIKRTGLGGSKFTIKKRLNQDLHKAEMRMNQKTKEIELNSQKSIKKKIKKKSKK